MFVVYILPAISTFHCKIKLHRTAAITPAFVLVNKSINEIESRNRRNQDVLVGSAADGIARLFPEEGSSQEGVWT